MRDEKPKYPPISPEEAQQWQELCEKATPGPWADLSDMYNRAMQAYKKTRGRWYHGTKAASTIVTLIGRSVVRGKPIEERDIPVAVDYWDIRRVISLRWSAFSKGMTSIGEGFFRPEDAVFIAAAREALPRLLAERAEDLLRDDSAS